MGEPRKTVLVVEDDEDTRSMLALSLKHAGFAIHTACDGLEALNEMKRRRFDAVITDYRMPRLNGLEFLSLSKKAWPGTPVVMVSGEGSDMIANQAVQEGAFACVHKPYERALLIQILRLAAQQPVDEHSDLAAIRAVDEGRRWWRSA